nr:RecName: Full=62 kDa cell wall protein [Solanum lycopersicum]
EVPLDDTGL